MFNTIVTVPCDESKLVLPAYFAVTRLLPFANWLPATVRLAVAEPPDPDKVAEPRVFAPVVNVTLPAGESGPEEARTVAVKIVLPVAPIVVGFAVTVVVVETDGGPTHE